MPSKLAFFVDGMTVEEILNLGDDVLSKLNSRDMSRALRTVSLAANKRINRLQQYAYKRHGTYIEKQSGPGLDLAALNKVGKKFGVGKKTRDQMYEEFARVRQFMSYKTSTVKGAKEARKAREIALFGKTREQLTKGMGKTKKREFIKNMKELAEDTSKAYHEFEEEYELSGIYEKEQGRKRIRTMGQRILRGEDPEKVKRDMMATETQNIVKEQTEKPSAFWQKLESESRTDDEEWKDW